MQDINSLKEYYLEAPGDMRDMTEQIEKKLTEKGCCLLGVGVFLVKGIKMPEESTLMGMGRGTKLLLSPEVECGAAVMMSSYCFVKDLSVLGALEFIERPKEVGERHGIGFIGTATHENHRNQHHNAIIEACQITSFTGGGITCKDTGYCTNASITASNCHIMNCGAGINIPHFSEYHEFTNMLCTQNLYGCINNGGNNVFVNCGFDSNTTAFLMDNTDEKSINNSHGSAVGCTFNHSDSNKGIGIQILGANVGYIFSACQMFYSKIVAEDAHGIVFTGFNYGANQDIIIKGGSLIMFTDSVFREMPNVTIENNDAVKFSDCYTRHGEEVKF